MARSARFDSQFERETVWRELTGTRECDGNKPNKARYYAHFRSLQNAAFRLVRDLLWPAT
jgi:hypothetical protein